MDAPKILPYTKKDAQVKGLQYFSNRFRTAILDSFQSEGRFLEKKHYHLIGICGTAMASLAGMLVGQGHKVTGSDENVYPPMSVELERLGIPVREGYTPKNVLERPEVVVVGNAITRGNPELEHVLNEKMYYTSMAAVVEENFIRGHHSIVVAGTHGKTTDRKSVV